MGELGDEAFEGGETEADLLEEGGIVRDEDETGVLGPEGTESEIDGNGLFEGLVADRVAALDGRTSDGSRLEEDDGVVSGQFRLEGGVHGLEIVMGFAGPIGCAIHRAAITEEGASREQGGLDILELSLDMEDAGLGRAKRMGFPGPWESTLEQDRCRLGNNHDPITDLASEEVGGCCLPAPWTAGDGDPVAVTGPSCRFHGWAQDESGALDWTSQGEGDRLGSGGDVSGNGFMMPGRVRDLRHRWMGLMLGGWTAMAVEMPFQPDIEAEPHRYFQREPSDAFTRRIGDLGTERMRLDRTGEAAFLRSLLMALGIPAESQLVVFSNTSLQLSLINPSNPRALYFSDDLYLGYVPGGKIEVATIDAELGAVFYIFDIPRGDAPVRVERARRCMNCHANEDTFHVPGLTVKSVAPGPGGGSLDAFRREMTGHGVPLAERLGGWHVTGAGGFDGHLGNRMGKLFQGELSWTPLPPGERFRWSRYPVATSDLLAHLVHEHQVGFVNRLVRAQYRARALRHEAPDGLGTEAKRVLDAEAAELVRYILFADEAPLPVDGLEGDAGFRKAFAANRRAVDGAALKDFELGTRLFRYRCSYLVHTPQFAGLDPEIRDRVVKGMKEALKAGEGAAGFRHLGELEKQKIREILRRTLPDLFAE